MSQSITIFSNIKPVFTGLLSHHYLSLPSIDLEIHPGKYYYGTHHNLGTFAKNSIKTGQYDLCPNCFKKFLNESNFLQNTLKYFPMINCETLTKGLLNKIAISYQSLIVSIFIIASILSLKSIYMFIIVILSILILIVLNNFHLSYKVEYCSHLKKSKNGSNR